MKNSKSNTVCYCKKIQSDFEFQHKNHSIVSFKDKGHATEYRYVNQSNHHLAKYIVDNGLIKDSGDKCDFLMLNCELKQSYFIELKGSDLIHAVEQIDRSIDLIKGSLPEFSFYARIVVTRVNTIDQKSIKLLRLEKKLKSLNGNLKKQSRLLEEKI